MLRLFLAAGAMELRAVAIVSNTLSIGRRPYNDLQLDDLTVSGEHAVLRVRNGEVSIHDLDSRNGTMVNGQPISQRELVDGDIIDIGIYRLRFEAARPGRTTGEESKVKPIAQAASVTPRASAMDPRVASAPAPRLVEDGIQADMPRQAQAPVAGAQMSAGNPGTPGASSGQEGEFAPPAHLACLSGTSAGQIQSLDRAINRVAGPVGQVAVVSRRKGGYFITHLEGLTFPQVNGEPIGLTAHRLSDGDLIELAGIMLRFRLDA